MTLRTSAPSDYCPFGLVTLRTSAPSDYCPFRLVNCPRQGIVLFNRRACERTQNNCMATSGRLCKENNLKTHRSLNPIRPFHLRRFFLVLGKTSPNIVIVCNCHSVIVAAVVCGRSYGLGGPGSNGSGWSEWPPRMIASSSESSVMHTVL